MADPADGFAKSARDLRRAMATISVVLAACAICAALLSNWAALVGFSVACATTIGWRMAVADHAAWVERATYWHTELEKILDEDEARSTDHG